MEHNFKKIQEKLLKWYDEIWSLGKNKYPWRFSNKSPYEILIAEILLMHTTVKAIIDNKIYDKFLKKYPNLQELNNSMIEELEELFIPIGLYKQKSKRIKKMTKILLENYSGEIPDSKNELKKIPMIGEYIGNALLTFAFNKNEVPLDGNLKRIALNVWGLKEKNQIIDFYKKLAEVVPKKIYWALFDLGRFHCRKPKPNCVKCPLIDICCLMKENKNKSI